MKKDVEGQRRGAEAGSALGARARPAGDGHDEDPLSLAGERFAKYLLVGEIAQGGMGEVFLAVQEGLEGFSKMVVVKRVLRHLTTNAEFTRMFIDEARLAARLEHSNIVRTYEFGEHEGQYYTVMEFLAGEDLAKVLYNLSLRSEQMALPLAIHITAQLCNGLHFAHELTDRQGRPLHLVHRDVNPANVIITYTGEVKMIDFGVAKVDSAAIKTVTGMLKGKFAYMSPEYILSRGLDRRADIFSAGIVLWEALTGRQLFARDTTASTMYAVMDDPIPPASAYRPEVPPQLDAIVARALARIPGERFSTADEMRNALDDFAATQPKVDSRSIARMMEDLFGTVRAQAMSSITQSRSLAHNISLVMKRPATMPTASSPVAWAPTAALPAAPSRRRRWLVIASAVATLAGVGLVAALGPCGHSGSPPAGSGPPPVAVLDRPATAADAGLPPDAALAAVVLPDAALVAAAPPDAEPTPPDAPPAVVDEPRPGTLTVATRANAVIYLDGAMIERGSFANRAVPIGRHELVIKIPGRARVQRSISIAANRETKVDVDAPPRPAVASSQPPIKKGPNPIDSGPGPAAIKDPPPDHATGAVTKPPVPDPPPIASHTKPEVAHTKPEVAHTKPEVAHTKPEVTKPDPAGSGSAAAKPTLDIAAVRAAVRSQIGPVQQCYERAKMDDPNLRGHVTVRITIAADGSVSSAQVASTTLSAPQVEGCITREIERWRLPKPAGGAAVSLSYPFVFE